MTGGASFGKIVVAFDSSKDSVKAVEVASSMAKEFGSKVIIVHVYSSPSIAFSGAAGMPIPNYQELEDVAKELGMTILTGGVKVATDAGVKARGELLEAPSVVQAIVDFALSEKADLLVAGTKGTTGFKRLLLGSVSSGIVSHAHCPVLVVR